MDFERAVKLAIVVILLGGLIFGASSIFLPEDAKHPTKITTASNRQSSIIAPLFLLTFAVLLRQK